MDLNDQGSAEYLLQDDLEGEKSQSSLSSFSLRQRRQSGSSILVKVLVLAIIFLLGANTLFLVKYNDLLLMDHDSAKSKYAGLAYNTPIVYRGHLDSMSRNWTQREEYWNTLDINPIAVALDNQWALDHGLPKSDVTFPWDPEVKRIYFLKVFHGLHCLKIIRSAFLNHERGNLIEKNPDWHVYHCLDTLRQDLMCSADDTPMAMMNSKGNVGEGQVRMCRNFDELVAWTKEKERNACYHRIAEHPELSERVHEKYAFCDKDSPYYPKMQAYFKENGYMPGFEPEETVNNLASE